MALMSTAVHGGEFDRVVRPREAARLFGVSRPYLYHLVKTGALPPPFTVGGRAVGWRLSTLEAYLAKLERGPTPAAWLTPDDVAPAAGGGGELAR